MKIGLIGLNRTGKTTLFELLSGKGAGAAAADKNAANIGACQVPDERIDFLSALYNPKKTTYAKIDLTDVAGFSASDGVGGHSGAAKFLNDVRPCDALIHVLRAFESESVVHDMENIDPARDLEAVETEMLFADLEMLEKRIARIKTGKKISKEQTEEIALLERCFNQLEEGGAIHEMALSAEEAAIIRGYALLTEKPRIAVVNMDERQWKSETFPNHDNFYKQCAKLNIRAISLCIEMELEISRLQEEDKKLFMEDLGVEQPGIAVLAMAVYKLLGLISFLTVGEDEVRAWTIEAGTSAKNAAGKIHSDIERGFIRAEVVKYDSLKELGSMAKVKEQGLFRLEGKEYTVADGDIINFRFNV